MPMHACTFNKETSSKSFYKPIIVDSWVEYVYGSNNNHACKSAEYIILKHSVFTSTMCNNDLDANYYYCDYSVAFNPGLYLA